MNPLFSAYFTSDLFGKGIFLSLLLLSVITWALLVYKWREQKRAAGLAQEFRHLFTHHRHAPLAVAKGGLSGPFEEIYSIFKQAAVEILQKNRQVLPEGQQATLSPADMNHIEGQLTTSISTLTRHYEKNLFILSTIVTLAPFLGLLGTVWGILLTFAELQHGGAVSANSTIMGGLAMALGTTVVGLVVAIPALLAYNTLRNKISSFSLEMEDFSYELLGALELNYRKVDQ